MIVFVWVFINDFFLEVFLMLNFMIILNVFLILLIKEVFIFFVLVINWLINELE